MRQVLWWSDIHWSIIETNLNKLKKYFNIIIRHFTLYTELVVRFKLRLKNKREKISYDHNVYESVDNMSLSYIAKNWQKKLFF